MARPKKKRTYVRKEDKLATAERQIEKLHATIIRDAEAYDEQIDKLKGELTAATYEKNQAQLHFSNVQDELKISQSETAAAIKELALIKESILQHQRTLELVTQTAHNNAQMGRDLISSLVAKDVVKSNNVVGMTDGAKAVNVDGYGRRFV